MPSSSSSAGLRPVILDTVDFDAVVVDAVNFPQGTLLMNLGIVTTGLVPLTINSLMTFQLDPYLDGLPWDLSGGSAVLRMIDASGVTHTSSASISAAGVIVNFTVPAPAGAWTRAWDVTDVSGRRQVSRPIAFAVVASP